ncbi:hypothetical protein MXD58_017640, partial [Frankia sp. AgKG'84/4]
ASGAPGPAAGRFTVSGFDPPTACGRGPAGAGRTRSGATSVVMGMIAAKGAGTELVPAEGSPAGGPAGAETATAVVNARRLAGPT